MTGSCLPAGTAGSSPGPEPPPVRPGRLWRVVAVLASVLGAIAGVLAARAAGPPADAGNASAPFAATEGMFSKGNGQPAPGWSLPALSGQRRTVALRQFSGRPVVVNFWASWCAPCRAEMPALERVSRLLAGRVAFAGLDTQDQPAAGIAFARKAGATYPLAVAGLRTWTDYGVTALPATFFVSAEGTVVGVDFGGMTQDSLLRLIRQLYGITPGD